MLKEFAIYISNMYLFPSTDDKQYLLRQDFVRKMEECSYALIKPHSIRQKFTEYVW